MTVRCRGLTANAACLTIAVGILIAISALQPSFGATQTVTFVNSTRTALVSLRLREAGTRQWQSNVLTAGSLGVQKNVVVQVPAADNTCWFDIEVRFEDGRRLTMPKVDLCEPPRIVILKP